MIRIAAAALAVLAAGCASLAPPTYEAVGYYAGWAGLLDADPRRLSAIDYAFLAVSPDGSVFLAHPDSEEGVLAHLVKMKRANPSLVLFASVGGWAGSSRFSDMASDAAVRARFVDSSIAFLRRYGFDGIDIDWEYPGAIGVPCAPGVTCDRPGDKESFVALAREMREALERAGRRDGKRYFLTVAAGADSAFAANAPVAPSASPWLARLAESLDWINLMSYDYHGTWERSANFVAPLYTDPANPSPASVDASVNLFLAQGVPPGKLVLGIPFYGKGWTRCDDGPRGDGLYQPCAELARPEHEATFEFSTLADAGFLGYERHWNAVAHAPWLYDRASHTFIAYDDERTVREKARYVRERGLRGAMFWEISADRHGVLAGTLAAELGR